MWLAMLVLVVAVLFIAVLVILNTPGDTSLDDTGPARIWRKLQNSRRRGK